MKSPAEFEVFYEKTLRPYTEELARQLESARNTALTIFGILALVAATCALLLKGSQFHGPIAIGAAIAAIGIPLLVYFWKKSSINLSFKHQVVKQIVSFLEPGLSYEPENFIGESAFRASQIFTHSIDRYKGEDMVSGKHGNVALSFSEIHAEYKTTTRDSKGRSHTTWHTIFKGVFLIADFNKEFRTTTVIVPDIAESSFGSLIGNFLQKMNPSRPGQLVKLEDPQFEKLFAVYGEDQVEARYLLSPAMMSRIMKLRERLGSQLSLSFTGSKLHMAIETKSNLFEMNSGCLESAAGLMQIGLDLCSLVEIVEDLDLETRIWTKT